MIVLTTKVNFAPIWWFTTISLDETADLLNELNKIKAEREEERKIEEVKKQEEEERIRTENILRWSVFAWKTKFIV